jgi:hypothetical protein
LPTPAGKNPSVPLAPAPVSDRGSEAPADGSEAADDRSFPLRYYQSLAARPGRLLTALVATTLAGLVVNEAAGRRPAPRPAAPAAFEPVLQVEAPPDEIAEWSVLARAAAGTCPGLYPEVLVAVAHVESRFGRASGRYLELAARAIGAMQFLPDTWATYATDGDGDGRADVMNPVDAMFGAARFLCAYGGADLGELRTALWRYHHSRDYGSEILRRAGLADVAA